MTFFSSLEILKLYVNASTKNLKFWRFLLNYTLCILEEINFWIFFFSQFVLFALVRSADITAFCDYDWARNLPERGLLPCRQINNDILVSGSAHLPTPSIWLEGGAVTWRDIGWLSCGTHFYLPSRFVTHLKWRSSGYPLLSSSSVYHSPCLPSIWFFLFPSNFNEKRFTTTFELSTWAKC